MQNHNLGQYMKHDDISNKIIVIIQETKSLFMAVLISENLGNFHIDG